jgi:acetyl-CoA C-acetyltransferase
VEIVIVALTARLARWHAGAQVPFSHSEAAMLVGSSVRRVAIVGGLRIPFARSMGAYAEASNQEMLSATLQALVERYGLKGAVLGDVGAGAVLKHSRDFGLTRECVLDSGLAAETPAFDLQRACGTSLDTAIVIGMKIAMGQIDSGIAAGVDTASDVPIVYPDAFRRIMLRSARGKSFGARLAPWLGLRPGHFKPRFPAVLEPHTGLSMGQHCELMAKTWQIPRVEQDQLALESHRKAAAAYEAGFFDDLVVEFRGLKRDNNIRPDTTLEKLAKLKPSFDPQGTLTAGNSTPMTDGAAAVLLASEEWAKSRGLPVLAYLSYGKYAAVDFIKKEGLLMAPAYAVPRMLADAGLKLQDFDFYEIHEAFAAQVLCTLKAWQSPEFCRDRLGLSQPLGAIDRGRMNVKGGSVAVGHPFAATGARIVATLAKLLATKGSGRGLISICAAGGMGVTAILER